MRKKQPYFIGVSDESKRFKIDAKDSLVYTHMYKSKNGEKGFISIITEILKAFGRNL